MHDNNSLDEKIEQEEINESTAENARTWEGRLGRRRFRVRWHRGQQDASFHFQAPFTTDTDPDGVGVPFSPDLNVVWKRGKGAHASGPYADRLNNLQRELPDRIEKARQDLEEALNRLRQNWHNREPSDIESARSSKGILSQRVRIEIEETEDPFPDIPPITSGNQASGSVVPSNSERAIQRRIILEGVRSGTISLEEADRQLSELD
jgi:hypothetical protein